MSRTAKSWTYALSAQVMWGTGGVVVKLINTFLPGSLLVALRHGIGSSVLGLAILRGRRAALKNLPWNHLLAMGILAAIPDLLLVGAVRRAGAIIAILILRLEIPLVVIFANWLLKEKISFNAYVAAILSLAGSCLISLKPGQSITLQNSFYIGIAMALIGAVLWALSGVYSKFLLNKKTDPLGLTFARLGIGSLFMLIVSLITIRKPLLVLQGLTAKDWFWIIYLGLFLSGLGYLLWNKSMAVIDVHIATVLLGVSVAVLLVLGLAIGEQISRIQWLGVVLVILGIYLVRPKEAAPD